MHYQHSFQGVFWKTFWSFSIPTWTIAIRRIGCYTLLHSHDNIDLDEKWHCIQHSNHNCRTGPWFNIKMSSCQYRISHCGDETVVRSSYLHNGISYTGKMSSLYWIRALSSQVWHLIIKIRRSHNHLIFIMGIPILIRQHLYIETPPTLNSQNTTHTS